MGGNETSDLIWVYFAFGGEARPDLAASRPLWSCVGRGTRFEVAYPSGMAQVVFTAKMKKEGAGGAEEVYGHNVAMSLLGLIPCAYL